MKTLLHKSLIAGIAILLSITAIAQNAKKTAPSNRLNFEYFESLIFIKVKVQNKPNLVFLLNTGANTSVIHTKTATLLKLKLLEESTVTGNAGQEKVRIARASSFQIGKTILKNTCLTARNLSAWSSSNGKTIDGIIGTDILSNFNVTIDYKNKTVYFAKKTDKPKVKFDYNIPFNLEDGMLKLAAVLDDSFETRLSFNSGVSLPTSERIYVNISPSVWQKMRLRDQYAAPVQYLSGNAVGGYVHLPVVQISKMEMEKFEIRQPFVVIQSKEGYYKNEGAIGFFGNNLLEKCQLVCVNFKENTICFNNPKPVKPKTTPVAPKTTIKKPAVVQN